MGKETERKYLVQSETWRDHVQGKAQLRQGYLSVDEERSVRVRIGPQTAVLTIKGKASGHTRFEFEYPLPLEDAQQMLEHLCLKPLISKTRYTVHANGLTWEIDEFADDNKPLILAELETTTDEEPRQKPEWLGADVSHDPRYFNSNLVTHPYSQWHQSPLNLDPTFHLKRGESVSAGLTRIVQEQFATAVEQLSNTESDLEECVHEVRKSIKKLRAVLRLMRPILGATYQQENVALRDIGRTLSAVRDAHALVETFAELTHTYQEQIGENRLPHLYRFILQHAQEREHSFDRNRHLPQLREQLRAVSRRAESWPYDKTNIHLLADSVATTVRLGRASYHAACADPSAEHFHEWRKRAKDLRYQLTLLEKLWPQVFEGYASAAEELEERLGMDHNLVVLRDTILAHRDEFSAPDELRMTLLLIDTYQQALRTDAHGLGQRIYSDSAKQWIRRIQRSWKAWKAERGEKNGHTHRALRLAILEPQPQHEQCDTAMKYEI